MDKDAKKPTDQRDGSDRRQVDEPGYRGPERRKNERRDMTPK